MINHIFLIRIINVFLSLTLIILTLPLQCILSAVLAIILKESPVYLQDRGISLDKYRFTMVKFKTIRTPGIPDDHRNNCAHKFLISCKGPEKNRFLRWMRRTGLDELPQLYNILRGEMNFIGPRPLMIPDLKIMKNDFPYYNRMRENITCRPGITGLWQLFGCRSLGIQNLMELDLCYDENKSLKMNLKIIFSTITVIAAARNFDSSVPDIN